jgi:hypothetical protein
MEKRLTTLILLTIALAAADNGFDFVVLGDRTGSAREGVFETALSEVKLLRPSLLMNVGDLVEGYTKSHDTLIQQWDTIMRLLRNTGVYYRLTPGNHDITDAMSESVFVRYFGGPHSSFNFGGSHFLIIDNSRWDSLPETELAWIDRDLALNRLARWTFVFMHRSYWVKALREGKADRLHNIFRQYGVDYVFSGHDHYYCSAVWDSIHYVQVGPTGSRYKVYEDEERGAFQNYLLVHCGDSAVRLEVVRPGSLLAQDCVTLKDIALLDSIDRSGLNLSDVALSPDGALDDSVTAEVRNVSNSVLSTRCEWNLAASNWRVEPETVVVVCSPGVGGQGSGVRSVFSVQLPAGASPYPLPSLNLDYPYGPGKLHEIDRLLPLRRSADCPKIALPRLDGVLNDKAWKKVKPIQQFGAKDGGVSPTEPFDVLLAHDDTMLFIAARCVETQMSRLKTDETVRDGKVANDDNLNFLLCPDVDSVIRNPQSAVYYQLIISPAGVIWDRKCSMQNGKSVRDNAWNGNWQVANSLDKNQWILELAIPLADFGVAPESGQRSAVNGERSLGFNIVRFQSRNQAVGVYQVPFVHDPATLARLRMQ